MLCALLLAANAAQSQKVGVKVNPLSIFFLTANLQGEYVLSDQFSFQLGIYYGAIKLNADQDVSTSRVRYNWMGITPEFRFYPRYAKKAAPQGLYMAPYLRFRRVGIAWRGQVYDPDSDTTQMASNESRVPTFGMGALVGYQVLFAERICLDMFIGPQFSVGQPDFEARCAACDGDERMAVKVGPDFTGMEIRAGAALGMFF